MTKRNITTARLRLPVLSFRFASGLTATLFGLAFALAPVEAALRPKGGPARQGVPARVSANSQGRAQLGMREDVIPGVSISFAPVGLTMSQTARLNLVNTDVANGITVNCRFIDANGAILAQSATTLTVGKIYSVDCRRHPDPAAK